MKRNRFRGLKLLAAACFAGSMLTACVAGTRHGRVYVRAAPPAMVVEVQGAAPGPDNVWIPGYHEWRGGVYVWLPGRWDRAPRPRAVWMSGQWKHHRDGWYWVEGHWK